MKRWADRTTSDTICALATPLGVAALAVIRVSGPDALGIADQIFKGRCRPSRQAGHTVLVGQIVDAGVVLDQAMITIFRGPHSYTGEDSFELSCHGGVSVPKAVLDLLIRCGARLARPGEFTRRAVENGKLDLVQAEAVLDVINARCAKARELALRNLTGVFSERIDQLRQALRSVAVHLTAQLEFAEELPATLEPSIERELAGVQQALEAMHSESRVGQLVRDGIWVVIVGAPNAGKSSLFNRLIGEDRAIVTPTPGTTRDALEAELELDGARIRLIDTAGWLPSEEQQTKGRRHSDPIETIGAGRARAYAARADVLLLVIDSSRPIERVTREILSVTRHQRRIIVLNKSDLPSTCALTDAEFLSPGPNQRRGPTPCVRVSALSGKGISRLVTRLRTEVGGSLDGVTFAITRRQATALEQAVHAIARARAAVAVDQRVAEIDQAGDVLSELLGDVSRREVLDDVFREFCIGK